MSGAYCRFCGRRCFVYRTVPTHMATHFATCEMGMEHDRKETGYDYTTAFNPDSCEDMRRYRLHLLALEIPTTSRDVLRRDLQDLDKIQEHYGLRPEEETYANLIREELEKRPHHRIRYETEVQP